MDQRELLKQIIDHLYDYAADRPGGSLSLAQFVGYLNNQTGTVEKLATDDSPPAPTAPNNEADDLGIHLVLLYRYAKEYVKRVLKDSPLQTADEFSFLITLQYAGSHTKTELINKMVLTKTSGTEVIKRLKQAKFVREYRDPADKRSKRVAITPAGQDVLRELTPQMSIASRVITGNLSTTELRTVNYLLGKLEAHHKEQYATHGTEALDDLLR